MTLLVLTGAAALAGCAAAPTAAPRPAYVKPGLIMLTADQAERRGWMPGAPAGAPSESAGPLDASAVSMAGGVKAYTIGRYVDPADPDLMHEEHVVYRRDSGPQWRLDRPADQKILIGPRVTDGRQELQPVLSKELTGHLTEQRRISEANRRAIESLFAAVEALNRSQQSLAAGGRDRPARASDERPGSGGPAAGDPPETGGEASPRE